LFSAAVYKEPPKVSLPRTTGAEDTRAFGVHLDPSSQYMNLFVYINTHHQWIAAQPGIELQVCFLPPSTKSHRKSVSLEPQGPKHVAVTAAMRQRRHRSSQPGADPFNLSNA
jgi:hypothetical protein